MSGRRAYARDGEIDDDLSETQTQDEIFIDDNSDYVDADDSEEGEDLLLQDALEEMVAQAEARDSFGTQFDDDDEDSEYIPSDEDVYQDLIQDAGGLEIEMADDDDEDEDDDEQEEEDDDDDEPSGRRGQSITIDIRELLRAHLAASNEEGSNTEDIGELNTRESITRALNSIGIAGLQRLLAAATGGAVHEDDDELEDDDDDDDDDEDNWYHMARSSQMADFWEPTTTPIRSGQELALGGEFGRQPKRPLDASPSAFAESSNMSDLVYQRKYARRRIAKADMASFVPNTNGTIVASYPARVYCGQYSQDSSFFYTCTQDFRVHMYDTTVAGPKTVQVHDDGPRRVRNSWFFSSMGTTQYTSLNMTKSIQGRQGNWTITDANLSPDNQWMIYSSITPFVHLVPTKQHFESGGRTPSDNQVMLDFSNTGDDDTGIWSIRFSGDSREIVAGAHFGDIYVYDIEARRRVLRVEGHSDDVNAVAFADAASSNVLISGSDDSFVKVWDRRSLSGGKPAGVLMGHTEGVTYVSPKGDGRYCISNGKDQSCRLWDLRMMHSSSKFDRMTHLDYGLRNWDYRNMSYRQPRYQAHPQDCSVMTYRGHAVLKTLIRCHFSPAETTGQKYIYSGSADGKIHIWNLDGTVAQVLDRSKVRPLYAEKDPSNQIHAYKGPGGDDDEESDDDDADVFREPGLASDPSSPPLPWFKRKHPRRHASSANSGFENPLASGRGGRAGRGHRGTGGGAACTVRDVSWHPQEPSLMSTAWDGNDGDSGSIAKHELADWSKRHMTLEDVQAQMALEARG
ncbi:WD_REPEATS_REGION domain-containing protein [Pseudozyma hubeiensis]|nr:WD_REPEATS_REGION domain-containing protein [Pseudozyma hubeiensis]